MKRTISVWSDWKMTFLKVAHFDRSVPSTALLYPAYKNNNQTRGGLGRVCDTRMYRSIGHAKFRKFHTGIFAEWKAPAWTPFIKMFGSLIIIKAYFDLRSYSLFRSAFSIPVKSAPSDINPSVYKPS